MRDEDSEPSDPRILAIESEFSARLEAGEAPEIEGYASRAPEIAGSIRSHLGELVLATFAADYFERLRSGEVPDPEAYAALYPSLAGAIRDKIAMVDLMAGLPLAEGGGPVRRPSRKSLGRTTQAVRSIDKE